MAIKWSILTLLHNEFILVTLASIAGVTYMDDFDFEERYRNFNECNPLHWHPLHLPEYCAAMYEKLIRYGIGFAAYPETSYEIGSEEGDYQYDETYQDTLSSYLSTLYQTKSFYPKLYRSKTYPQTPYQKMLNLLKKDIKKDPSRPKLGVLPNLGPVVIYNQEISKKSASMIKDLATAYGKYGQEKYADYLGYNDSPDPQLYVWDSGKNNITNHIKDQKDKNVDRISRTKTKKGGVVTIVETLRPRRRRQALYWFDLLL